MQSYCSVIDFIEEVFVPGSSVFSYHMDTVLQDGLKEKSCCLENEHEWVQLSRVWWKNCHLC